MVCRASRLPRWGALLSFLAVSTLSVSSLARRNGYQGDCQNCHTPGGAVTVTLDPEEFEPGETVRIHVAIENGGAQSGGVMLQSNLVGEFRLLDGQGLKAEGPYVATHSQPKGAQNGLVTFDVDWIAPADPAAFKLKVNAVAANNDNNRSGDAASTTDVSKVVGCLGATFYRDFDGDGFGSSDFDTTVDCAPPLGFALEDGDCNEDEADINPGQREICNEIDDNCNGRVDDRATPTCGLGLCRREAAWCGTDAPCFPGEPYVEQCNGLDDDCDGYIDRGMLCEGDLVCHLAVCKPLAEAQAVDPNFVPYEGQVEPGLEEVPPPAPIDGMGGAPSDSPAQSGAGTSSVSAPLMPGMPTAQPGAAAESGGCGVARGFYRGTGTLGIFGLLLGALAIRRRRRR
jgi:hypothetical protein